MKRTFCSVVIAATMALTAAGLRAEGSREMKMSTPIPEGIETPTRLETHLGVDLQLKLTQDLHLIVTHPSRQIMA